MPSDWHYDPDFQQSLEALEQVFRPPIGLSGLHRNSENTELHTEEIWVLFETMLLAVNALPQVPSIGTLILESQRTGEEASRVLSVCMRGGSLHTCTDRVEETIKEILNPQQNQPIDPTYSGLLKVHVDGRVIRAMTLSTPRGRFLAAVNFSDTVQDRPYDAEEVALLALAVALYCLRGNHRFDHNFYFDTTDPHYQYRRNWVFTSLVKELNDLIDFSSNSVFSRWRKWHQEWTQQNGELDFFT